MDQILIRDLRARGIIGVHPHERHQKQEILINISMAFDTRRAGETDSLHDTVDYQRVSEQILAIVDETQYFLIERLASHIASSVLSDYPVQEVHVSIDKPSALQSCRSVAVQITRKR